MDAVIRTGAPARRGTRAGSAAGGARSRGGLAGGLIALLLMTGPFPAPDAAETKSPSLVVVIIVDMLPTSRLEEIRPLLKGGIGRLFEEGIVFPGCAHAHAMTHTAPGHATLLSGLLPRHHGVIMNAWYDNVSHREVYCVEDPSAETRRPNFNARTRRDAVSPDLLLGENLADALKRSRKGSKVYTISGKDRSAVLSGGHRPDGAFWYNRETGGYTSNPSILPALPAWGEEFWMADPWESPLFRRNIPDAWSYAARPEAHADDYPYEGPAFSRTAPHPVAALASGAPDGGERGAGDAHPSDVAGIEERARQVLFSPWGDWLTLQLASRILDHEDLGRDEDPDLLVVALSSADAVGHTYGPHSQEYLDLILRLDGWLGEFMRAAEKASARTGGAVFALSADHGVLPLPETRPGARRIDPRTIEAPLQAQLKERLAPDAVGPFVASVEGGHVYLDRRTLATHGIPLDRAIGEARRILSGFWSIARVYRSEDLASDEPGDPDLDLNRASWHPERGGDLVIQPCRECLFTSSAEGTSHGTVYEYDRNVPMILMGPGIGRGRSGAACRTVDLAPTLAGILGLTFASPRDGSALPLAMEP